MFKQDLAKVLRQRKQKNLYGNYIIKIKKLEIKCLYLFISLYLQLKNPVFQAVEETLRQNEYGFDELQLKECKEILEKKEFRFLLIMDSYDEMKLENILKNLYMNNKVKQNWSDPLVIFTTRSEIFTSCNYAFWFAPGNKEKFKGNSALKIQS
ncbi:unnamed protein product (macronuclear) [Paramecium tetraurelia]|uniref:NB-ARC domain-containing protein n=1 Tax=Paramecium tetraurelia TaxID=5888 RepID=A0CLS9_PARTE|nr:uncharacterized protein GSPATT00038671001 [Paramecium tetraurelia]CAK71746.1 unnamed protein product [Paramecium tetraurelia]|eukprot:XP_001439143.1 hypothetical protein (macronuclear) [Paramecium tetraurelia strain d4-2]